MSSNSQHHPPKLAKWLLNLSVAWRFKEEAEDDLDELFRIRVRNRGLKEARREYWSDVLSIWMRRGWFEEFEFTHLNFFSMLKNYIKVTFRTLKKQKVYSFINVFGLSVGLAFCCLIFLYVQDELSYDQFNINKERIYRVEKTFFSEEGGVSDKNSTNSIPLGPTLKAEIPGVESFTRIFSWPHYVKVSDEAIQETVFYADPGIFEIFTFPLVSGNTGTMLYNPNWVVISAAYASKYFGTEDPVGKILQIRKQEIYEDFVVTGVIENIPLNSSVRFDILISIKESVFYSPKFMDHWGMNIYQIYVMLNNPVNKNEMNPLLDNFYDKYHAGSGDVNRGENNRAASYRFNPLTQIHLNSVSDPKYSFILSGIALAILIIACINFMTLSIGRSAKRSKEIGMRKVIGAHRHQLMFQFWGEAFIICTISLALGLILAQSFLPIFNSLSGKALEFQFLDNWITLLVLTGLIIFTGFIAGSYPAAILSKIKPVTTLKGAFKLNGSNLFTKSLVTLQFALSVLLIIGTLVMNHQLQFIQNQKLGFDKENVVVVHLNQMDGSKTADLFRNTMGQHAGILDITAAGYQLGRRGSSGYRLDNNGKEILLNVMPVESNYLDFMGIELVAGRDFDPNLSSDTTDAVLVNEALVREMEIEDPIGKLLPGLNPEEDEHAGAYIVGIVKDHYFQSLYTEMEPALFSLRTSWGLQYLMFRVQPNHTQETIALIDDTWKQLFPGTPFSYRFLDDNLNQSYQNDQRWAKIINYSSLFAILIACMGLFGLVTITVTSRQKEVGIRKVLGASITSITTLFAKDFVKLIIIGVVIASPIAWYAVNKWLTNFAYHISIGAVHFITAILIVLLVAIVTISVQTIRAGWSNPAETLMNE